MHMNADEEEQRQIIETLEIPRCCEEALIALMAEPSIIERSGSDPHLAALLSEAHTNTWFCVEGKAEVARNRKGSRPGCALADF
eukprot:12102079-Heterocapsa_arctica.AAC.1